MTPDETHAVPAHGLADEHAADAVVEGWSRALRLPSRRDRDRLHGRAALLRARARAGRRLLPPCGRPARAPSPRRAAAPARRSADRPARPRTRHGSARWSPFRTPRCSPSPCRCSPCSDRPPTCRSSPSSVPRGAPARRRTSCSRPRVSRAPRRQLVRVFTAFADEPRRIAVAGVLLCALALAAVAGAIVLRPSFSPMYELENSIAQQLSSSSAPCTVTCDPSQVSPTGYPRVTSVRTPA